MMDIRFPASTPRVSRSAALRAAEIVLIDAAQFEDDRRRIVVGPEISDDTMKALGEALDQHDRLDGMRRWFADLVTAHADGSL